MAVTGVVKMPWVMDFRADFCVFSYYLDTDDEWDSLVSIFGFYVEFGVGLGQ